MGRRNFILCSALLAAVLVLLFSEEKYLPASENVSTEVSLPAIMYHSVLKDPARTGEYVVTPQSFENDLKYLSQKGYTAVSPEKIGSSSSSVRFSDSDRMCLIVGRQPSSSRP